MHNTDITLIDRVRSALRISTKNDLVEQEIRDLIEACKLDLKNAGVHNLNEADPLIIRAAILYVKAGFGYHDKAEQFKESYNLLKMSLSLAGDYNSSDETAAG